MKLPLLIVSQNTKLRDDEIEAVLKKHQLTLMHPDLLFLSEKLGIETIKKVHQHLNWKPTLAKFRAVVINPADSLTFDAQNALLKVLEEPSPQALIILGADSEDSFLETIKSRVEINSLSQKNPDNKVDVDFLANLLRQEVAERLEVIEKTEDRKKLISSLVEYYHKYLTTKPYQVDELKLLIQAEAWVKQNVSAKAVSDFLMIKLQVVGK